MSYLLFIIHLLRNMFLINYNFSVDWMNFHVIHSKGYKILNVAGDIVWKTENANSFYKLFILKKKVVIKI